MSLLWSLLNWLFYNFLFGLILGLFLFLYQFTTTSLRRGQPLDLALGSSSGSSGQEKDRFYALGRFDATMCYREIFEVKNYWHYGIRLRSKEEQTKWEIASSSSGNSRPRKSIVIDAGANVGMFTAFLAREYPHIHVDAFEPIPDTFKVLQLNTRRHASQQLDKTIHVHQMGLSAEQTTATFKFNPFLSMASSMHGNEIFADAYNNTTETPQTNANVLDLMHALVQDLVRINYIPTLLTFFPPRLINTLLAPSRRTFSLLLFWPLLISTGIFCLLRDWYYNQSVVCQLTTLSEFIRGSGVDEIELLKIDCEGAEEDILRGILPSDWKKVKQLVIEVHDVRDRVARMKKQLLDEGFIVNVEQEEWCVHKLMHIYTIFAKRLE